MSKPSLVIVIVEDNQQKMLLYRYLIKRGLKRHTIRINRSPSGQGSAESWVRKTWVKEIRAYRSRHAQTALAVVIDADASAVQHRLSQLDEALTGSGEETVTENEQIARLVPKRNVETWILCLNGQPVDEETDYKRTRVEWSELIASASETLLQWTQSPDQPPENCVSSLRRGVREIKRLTF